MTSPAHSTNNREVGIDNSVNYIFHSDISEMRIYRLNTGESAGSAVTKSLSVSNGSPSPGPVMTELGRDPEVEARLSRRVGAGHYGTLGREQMYRHRPEQQSLTGDMMTAQMSHSYTLPHSLSHHSSKIDLSTFVSLRTHILSQVSA